MTKVDRDALPDVVRDLAREVAEAGGRLFVVGGWVRDAVRGVPSKDFDLEIYDLDDATIDALVAPRGFTPPVGRQFAVWRHTRDAIDVATPRGAVDESLSPEESFAQAARGRDLRVNALAFDPLDGTILDPLGGRDDLTHGRLRVADAATFGEDPVRVLRVARLAAVLGAAPDEELVATCRSSSLDHAPPERLAAELDRMLLELPEPWRAIEWLEVLGHLDVFPPVAALADVPQDPQWHPEGDVFVHTGMVVDQAARIARDEDVEGEARAVLMWSALCHDLGKPATTEVGEDGRVRSHAHDTLGADVTRAWLRSLRLGEKRIAAVELLVRHHLAPALFVGNGAKAKGYRRLARKLAKGGVTPIELERVARADHLGRTTADALAGSFEEGRRFLERAREAFVAQGPPDDVVRAATLMRLGVEAGPELGRLLARAREIQDETGSRDEDAIASRVLRERAQEGSR